MRIFLGLVVLFLGSNLWADSDPMIDPKTGLSYPRGTATYTPHGVVINSGPMTQADVNSYTDPTVRATSQAELDYAKRWTTQSDGIERYTDLDKNGKQRLAFTPQKLTAADCLVGRHWELVPTAMCVCDGDTTHKPVSNDNPNACIGITPPPPPIFSSTSSPVPSGGTVACQGSYCVMQNGDVIDTATGQRLGMAQTDRQGNLVVTDQYGNVLGQVNVGGTAQNGPNGLQVSSPIVDSFFDGHQGKIVNSSDASGNIITISAGGYTYDNITGQVRGPDGRVVGSGTVGPNGLNLTFSDGTNAQIAMKMGENGQAGYGLTGGVTGVTGSASEAVQTALGITTPTPTAPEAPSPGPAPYNPGVIITPQQPVVVAPIEQPLPIDWTQFFGYGEPGGGG